MKNQKIMLFCAVGLMALFLNGCVQTKPKSQSPYIGAERAKNTALQEAGISSGTAPGLAADLKTENGQDYYEISFDHDQRHYIYHIDPLAGTITSRDVSDLSLASGASGSPAGSEPAPVPDAPHTEASQQAAVPQSGSQEDAFIGEEKAKNIALAKVPGAADGNIYEFKTDYDDGRMEYEGEIKYNGMEYEFEIDAFTGEILSWEAEPQD